MRVVSIDFDGVIHNANTVPAGRKMGEPMPGAIEAINELWGMGYKCIVYTVRASTMPGTKAVMDWLDYWKFEPMAVVAIKPNCDWYIDDKALHFESWKQVMGVLRG